MRRQAKLRNADGELIAEGLCHLDEERGEITMWPDRELRMLGRSQSSLALEMDDGQRLSLRDKHMIFRLGEPAARSTMYRLWLDQGEPAGDLPASSL